MWVGVLKMRSLILTNYGEKMFQIKHIQVKNQIVLAPLAGYTNLVYRKINKEMGVGLVYTEMISAKGLLYDNDKTWNMLQIAKEEHPIAAQLFGGDIDDMVKAAILIDTKSEADIIDINMGCPVKKVLKAEAGSKLLLTPEKIYTMVSRIVENVSKPVSVKIRVGWDHQSINGPEVARLIERAGASLITVHGRTKTDLYRGKVNLDYIKQVKDAVSIPVIGNGDIKSIEDAQYMLDYTGVDAVMIGRGSFGNPWLIQNLVEHFEKRPLSPPPTKEEKISLLRRHFLELCVLKGEKLAVLEMRSLAAWYVKGLEHAKSFKQKLVHLQTKDEFLFLLEQL